MRVRWLRRALENLNAEAEYIAQDSHSAACEMFQYVKTSSIPWPTSPPSAAPAECRAPESWSSTATR